MGITPTENTLPGHLCTVVDALRGRGLQAVGAYCASPHTGFVLVSDHDGSRLATIRLCERGRQEAESTEAPPASLDLIHEFGRLDCAPLDAWIEAFRAGKC